MAYPIGPDTPPGAAVAPSRTPMHGRHVSLVPASPLHATSLFQELCGPDRAETWTYMPIPCPDDESVLARALESFSTSADPLYFVVLHREDAEKPVEEQRALGIATFMSIVPEHRRIEIGWIILGESLKRTRMATEVFYVFMKNAFDELGYLRLEWKCDSLNKPSRDAAARLGFLQHIIYKGRRRDTAWFSVMQDEWAAVKKGLEKWLDDDNFDDQGKQKRKLQDCREL
ncbi:acetyltransferase (GNAT) domain-containing protein [Sarocladium implicatum]|nr:acetyltransferase (GNAT) domain-containing protein [Sarocladium implicatum]